MAGHRPGRPAPGQHVCRHTTTREHATQPISAARARAPSARHLPQIPPSSGLSACRERPATLRKAIGPHAATLASALPPADDSPCSMIRRQDDSRRTPGVASPGEDLSCALASFLDRVRSGDLGVLHVGLETPTSDPDAMKGRAGGGLIWPTGWVRRTVSVEKATVRAVPTSPGLTGGSGPGRGASCPHRAVGFSHRRSLARKVFVTSTPPCSPQGRGCRGPHSG